MKLLRTNLIFIIFVLSLSFFISGCYKNIDQPGIVYVPPPPPPQQSTVITPPVQPSLYPPDWYSFQRGTVERRWIAIIVHHSATQNGNMATFNKEHLERGWNGVGYDFVIGNGTYSGDGQVEVTYRWKQQVTGAHTGDTTNNWANEKGIGTCLVGDFDKSYPTQKQMLALAKLVKFLQIRYGVPAGSIYGHGTVPGGHATDCPGKNFSLNRLKLML